MTVEHLIFAMKKKLGVKMDYELCAATGITPPQLSKLRAGTLPVGATHLIKLHEATGVGTKDLKALLALPEKKK